MPRRGRTVMRGGEVLGLKNAKEGTTLVILQTPLDDDEPAARERSEGRFLALTDQYLDKMVCAPRRKVTIVGDVESLRAQPLGEGEIEYSYPVLRARHVNHWGLGFGPSWYDPWY